MTLAYSTTIRDARLNSVESTTGTTPKLHLRTGSAPANCAAADTGTLLAELTLPSDWMAAASSGSKALAGTWTGTAVATGTAAHFRIKNSAGSTTHIQGSCSLSGGGGDMILDAVSITSGDTVNIATFTLNAGNA